MPARAFLTAVLLPILAAFAPALCRGEDSLPDCRLGMRTAPLLLLSRPDIRADLGLSDEQTASAERAIATLYAKAAALKGKTGAAAVAARQQIDVEQQAWLQQSLNATQYSRLIQIDLQWEGPSALVTRPVVTQRLNLSGTQVEALRKALEQRNRDRDPRAYNPAVEAQFARTALAVLSKPQQEQWKTLLGPAFRPRVAQASPATRR